MTEQLDAIATDAADRPTGLTDSCRPEDAEAQARLGDKLREQGDLDAAIEAYEGAVAARPDFAQAHRMLAVSLQHRGRLAAAEDCYRHALALEPEHVETLANFGVLLLRRDRLDDAIASFERAIALNPDCAEAHCNLAVALLNSNRLAAAIGSCDRALAVQPDFVDAAWNRGLALLAAGDLPNGWADYERRWQSPRHKPREYQQKLWRGEGIAGKTILAHHEQGLGDTIQFLRYVPLLAERGARVVVEVQPPLVALAATVAGASQIVAAGAALPDFDVHCPLVSLPERFGTSLDTIPAAVPYLAAAPPAVARWRARLGDAPGLKVGLVWAGNPVHRNDRNRSLAPERLLPLLQLAGIRWFGLQIGERAGDLARLPFGLVADLSPLLTDFAETAAVVANLDLVLAADTAIVHLAGALGRPCWVMLPFAPDWRWLLDRTDSPWYPSLRLFRQPAPGDWASVMPELRLALAESTGQPAPPWPQQPSPAPAATAVDPQAVYDAAMAHYAAGRIERADAAACELLAYDPAHAGAHHLRGLVALRDKHYETAIEMLQRAVALDPSQARAHNNLGIALVELNRRDEAIGAFRRAVACDDHLDDVHCNLGVLLRDAKRLGEAADSLQRAIAQNPRNGEAHRNLGHIAKQQGRLDASIASYREALAARPDHVATANELGIALHEAGRLDEAADSFRRALTLRPDYAAAHTNLGNVLAAQERLDDAAICHRRAIAARPDFADAHGNLGSVLQQQGRLAEAIDSYRRALRVEPAHVHAHLNLALAQLLLGDFEPGWREYEWRWRLRPPRQLNRPLWSGEAIAGRTILVHHEQGFGDTLQFLRYIPLLAQRGARVVVEVQPALTRLAATVENAGEVIAAGSTCPDFDVHCPLASLPERFATRFDTIPAAVPYLYADPAAFARWRRRLADAPGLKVGLAWAGSRKHSNDRTRSIPLERLRPLFDVPNICWFSLQVGEPAGDLACLPTGQVRDLSDGLTDFAETAAAVANLDLVVAVDTAVVHLAGALGRPCWVMLPFAPDWRWLLDRTDSPWYPSLRLFRQPAPGDWDRVLGSVGKALAAAPFDVSMEFSTAVGDFAAGRLAEAEAAAARIRRLQPSHAGAHQLLGGMALHRGEYQAALELSRQAAVLGADDGPLHNNLGIALSHLGRSDEAIDSLRRAVGREPGLADAHCHLGRLLAERQQLDDAAEHLERAVALAPDHVEAEAALGALRLAQGNLDAAEEHTRRLLARKPHSFEAHDRLGRVLRLQGQPKRAIASHRRALAYRPDFAEAHVNLGLTCLLLGDFAEGWRHYAWRSRSADWPLRECLQPVWRGEDIAGKTILVHHEQGLGDTIQCLRYVPLLARRNARVIVEVPPALARLAATVEGAVEIVAAGAPLSQFDVHCPLPSLPERFATRLDTIPAAVPYLFADVEAAARWSEYLGPRPRRKIGLVWAGGPKDANDRNRSVSLKRLQPLFEVPEISWFSLQLGERAGDMAHLSAGQVTDLSTGLTDFAETAAAVAGLDLVLAVDTVIVHLAGALGRPCWVMLPFAPDWRWLLDRDDNPWYPSLRLFRQPAPGDWDAVVTELRRALCEL